MELTALDESIALVRAKPSTRSGDPTSKVATLAAGIVTELAGQCQLDQDIARKVGGLFKSFIEGSLVPASKTPGRALQMKVALEMIDPSECRAAVAALGAARARLDEVKDPSIDPLKQYVSEAIVALNEKAATNVSLPPDTDRLAAALELRGRALRFVTGTSTAPGACPEKPGAARLGNHADSQAAPAGVTLRALRLVGLVLPDKRSELTKMEPRVRTDPGYEKDQLRWLIPFFEAKHQKFCVGLSPTCLPPPDDDIKDLKARQCELLQGAAREPAATPK